MRILIFLLFTVVLPLSSKGQITDLLNQEEPDSVEITPPQVLELNDTMPTPSDLIIAYERSAQMIREIRNELLTGFQIDGISRDYESLHNQLEQYYEIDSAQIKRSSLSAVNDRIIIFERRNAELAEWQEELTQFTTTLSQYLINLTRIKDSLRLDYGELGVQGQEYYDHRFKPLLGEADSLNTEVNRKLGQILELEYHVSQEFAFTATRIEALQLYLRNYWRDVKKPEPETWKFQSANPTENSANLSQTTWRITSFFVDNLIESLVLFGVVVAFFMILIRIRHAVESGPEPDEDLRGLYKNPVALSLIFGGVLFPMLYPPTTTLIYDFLLLVSYVPFLFILHNTIVPKAYRQYLVFFCAFVLLKLQNLFLPVSGYSSLILIACALVFTYSSLFAVLRKYFSIRWKWVRVFNYILGGTAIAGIFCIFFTRYTLGKILINGAGESIAIAYILIFLATWFDKLIRFIKGRPRMLSLSSDREKLNDFWLRWNNRIYSILLILYIIAILRNFNILNNVYNAIASFITEERTIGDLSYTIGGIVLFVLMIYIATNISSAIKFFTEDKSYYHSQKRTANLSVILRFFVVTIGFVLALIVSGIPMDKITIILGALSVGIGFGLQNIVNNLISGLILIFERPIQSGDIVEVQQYMGVVKDIGIRSSVIRTYDGSEIILPNGDLISQPVTNWTLSNKHRRVEVRVGVAYGSDAAKTTEVLAAVLEDHEKILRLPKPLVLFDGFGDSSLNFRMLFWTSDIDVWMATRSEIMTAVYDALAAAKIEIPFPQRDLHIRSWDPKAAPADGKQNSPPKKTSRSKPKDTGGPNSESD